MGTNLFAMGLASGDSPELWNDSQRDKVFALHKSFVDAGADIILTNSFGANRRRLMLHGLQGRVRELNRLAAEIAREAADRAHRPVIVAGSVGPTGDLLAPLGPISAEEAFDVFVEQIEGLKDGGADVAWIETMSAPEEMRAAAMAAGAVSMPFAVTASFDTAGKTMMGLAPVTFAALTESFEPRPDALGANCGVGASDLLVSILAMTQSRPHAVVIAKANAGIPQWRGAHIHYSGTPDLMADYACLAVDAGARIVGGCCGTSAAHLAAMRRALDARAPGERPDEAKIVAALGALAAPPAKAQAPRERERRRRALPLRADASPAERWRTGLLE
jgi:5-methyltetrahydrofolate--homocysteine methyltransferase